MTLLGKVFTGMVFVLSVSFFVLALMVNSSHINYRTLVEDPNTGFKVQNDRLKTKNEQLSGELQRAKNDLALEQAARRSALAALQIQLEQMSTDLANREKNLSDLQSQLTTLSNTENLTQKELKARTDENELLRQQLKTATDDRNVQYQKYVATLDSFLRLQGEKKSIEGNYKDLIRDHTAAKEKLDVLGITPHTKLDGPPAVNGVLTAVSSSRVELSLGKDDGIRVGHSLDVYRGANYLGRVKVTTSEANRSVADILPTYQKGFMQAGDRVDSRLSDIYVPRPVSTP